MSKPEKEGGDREEKGRGRRKGGEREEREERGSREGATCLNVEDVLECCGSEPL